jgi:uncharacterized LabA/DUF88 family protein
MWNKQLERVAYFIDGSNFTATLKEMHLRIDFPRLIPSLPLRNIYSVGVHYYSAVHTDGEGVTKIKKYLDYLSHNGYILHTKPAKEFAGVIKGNMDVDMAVDMLVMSPHYDRAVLFSGDGDFIKVVSALQAQCKNVTVVSTMRTHPPMIDNELRKTANSFVDLDEIRMLIESD